MLRYPDIDPVALDLGPVAIHWYGVTYLFAFLAGWWLAKHRARRPGSGWNPDEVGDAVFYIVVGVIAGGKLGSLLFYQTDQLLADPLGTLNPFAPGGWRGMSFHGGFIGVLVAFWLYGRNTGRTFFQVSDFFTPAFPIGLGAGRIGNFINGELYGRVTDVPWGMSGFPGVENEVRHPNQLYQFFFEGVVLFLLIWWFSSKPRPRMTVSGLFVLFYGLYRFGIEFVRQPDAHLGFVAMDWLTMGQLLSLPMIFAGAAMMIIGFRRGIHDTGEGVTPRGGSDGGGRGAATASAASSGSGRVAAEDPGPSGNSLAAPGAAPATAPATGSSSPGESSGVASGQRAGSPDGRKGGAGRGKGGHGGKGGRGGKGSKGGRGRGG